VSDLLRLNQQHIKGDLIHITTVKTGNKVVIPIHPKAKAILGKYGGTLPSGISDQKYNAYIKEVAQLAGLDEPINQKKSKGGKDYTETSPKYQLIASHTARRSFATNAYKAEVKPMELMMITGHTTEKKFLKYIRVEKEENAKKLLEHDFFKAKN